MASADERNSTPVDVDPADPPISGNRIRRALAWSRQLGRVVYRDPEHVAERLTLYATERLADQSQEWADATLSARPETPRAHLAEELRVQSAKIARIDGAIAGTPFFVALVPGYLTYLWQEMRMTLRTAALYGHDLHSLQTASEMLALRGVHPDVESARAALAAVQAAGVPTRRTQRISLRTLIHSVYLLLVFGGFMSPSAAQETKGAREWIRAAFSCLVAGTLWVTTWVFPVTFMIVMAWGCETHARQLGRRTLVFYDGEAASVAAAIAVAGARRDRGHDKRTILRAIALFLSLALPIAFIAYVDHVRNTVGVNWLGAIGALVALSLVTATAVLSSRR